MSIEKTILKKMDVDWYKLGQVFVEMDSKDQGLFVAGFLKGLDKYESELQIGQQMLYIADELSDIEKNKIVDLLHFVELSYEEDV